MKRKRKRASGARTQLMTITLSVLLALQFATPEVAAQEAADKSPRESLVSLRAEACRTEIVQYCSDIEPGEGRLTGCLRGQGDALSQLCVSTLDALSEVIRVLPARFSTNYPTLENRELGEAVLDADGDTPVWDHRLPFFAQEVLDLGFELPNPYGVALLPIWIKQELILEDLAISFDGGPFTVIESIEFTQPEAENVTLQLKLDAWVFPFMNAFVTVGKLNGEATIPLTVSTDDLFPGQCSSPPFLPICGQTVSAVATPSYNGENITLGINLAMGWQEFFVTLPITYTWSEVDISDSKIEALNITPRIGVTGTVGDKGMIAAFIGATYLSAEVDLTGRISFDTPGGPDGEVTTLDYRVSQSNRDKWNYLLGFNWDIDKNWSVTAEAGFGGTRSNVIAGFTYRY
jgi:hypothetical protein